MASSIVDATGFDRKMRRIPRKHRALWMIIPQRILCFSRRSGRGSRGSSAAHAGVRRTLPADDWRKEILARCRFKSTIPAEDHSLLGFVPHQRPNFLCELLPTESQVTSRVIFRFDLDLIGVPSLGFVDSTGTRSPSSPRGDPSPFPWRKGPGGHGLGHGFGAVISWGLAGLESARRALIGRGKGVDRGGTGGRNAPERVPQRSSRGNGCEASASTEVWSPISGSSVLPMPISRVTFVFLPDHLSICFRLEPNPTVLEISDTHVRMDVSHSTWVPKGGSSGMRKETSWGSLPGMDPTRGRGVVRWGRICVG